MRKYYFLLSLFRRSGSGVSIDSISQQLSSPTAENWDSSDTDSDENASQEAKVISATKKKNVSTIHKEMKKWIT